MTIQTGNKGTVDYLFQIKREGNTYWTSEYRLPGFTAAGSSLEECMERVSAYMAEEYPRATFALVGPVETTHSRDAVTP